MNILMEVTELKKSINGKVILNNMSFKLQEGRLTVLLGPNGSGKTTTLKILSNLMQYNSGEIILNQEIQDNYDNIMQVFDEPILYEELTGMEHIYFNAELYNIKLTKENLDEYLNLFQIEEYICKPINTYSLGMKKKLQLLCTIINNPRILLLDEYISGLDPTNLYSIKKILKNYVRKGNSILLSTHMLDVAETFCDDVLIINNGIVLNDGVTSVEEIKNKYHSLEEYYMKSILIN
jgi:ABC-2 type transport system ATP-binding protein